MWPWYNGEINVQVIWLADTLLTIRSSRFSEECPSDESDWRRSEPWLLGERDLIGCFVWTVLGGRFWLAALLELSLADASDWLLRLTCFSRLLLASQPSDVRHAKRWRRKRLREGVFFAVTNTRQYAVLTCICRLKRFNERHLNNYLLYLWWNNVTVHYALLSRAP